MNKELKKAIVAFIIDNDKNFQLINAAVTEFRQYIYTPNGEYCFGGEKVYRFIQDAAKLLA